MQKLMSREADRERLDHREAGNGSIYLGKPKTHTHTLNLALHHRWRPTHVSHLDGRHQLMRARGGAGYTSAGTCAYINACAGSDSMRQ